MLIAIHVGFPLMFAGDAGSRSGLVDASSASRVAAANAASLAAAAAVVPHDGPDDRRPAR